MHHTDPRNGIFFLPGMSPKISQSNLDIILYGEGDCSQTPSENLGIVDTQSTESVVPISFLITKDENVKTEAESTESVRAIKFAIAEEESSQSSVVSSSSMSRILKLADFTPKSQIQAGVVLTKCIELQTI